MISWFASLFLGQALELNCLPNFYGAYSGARDPAGDFSRVIEAVGLDQEIAAQLFARFGQRAADYHSSPVSNAHAASGGNRQQRRGIDVLPSRIDLVCELYRFRPQLLQFSLAYLPENLFTMMN